MKTKAILVASILSIVSIIDYFTHNKSGSFAEEIFLFSSLSLIAVTYFLFKIYFLKPLQALKLTATQSLGDTDSLAENKINTDFDAATAAINHLSLQIHTATEFILQIEKGNLEAKYNQTNEAAVTSNDPLAVALTSMRNQLHKIAVLEKERNWTIEGLAKFVDILRKNTYNIQALSDDIISHIVKYLHANQGGLFLYNETPEPCLELVASYAFERRKYLQKRIEIGQGLVGQAFLEKEYIYLTQTPDDYITITSGLGGANPTSILIVPLKFNDQVLGILEIASFQSFEKYQIEFLEKLSENIASTLSNVRVAEQTKKLLEESQQHTQIMKTQEEEMRQNMEELIATQENQQRLQEELKENEEKLYSKLSELEEAKKGLESKEAELRTLNEKNLKKSNQYKAKMEELDMQIEGKDSQISILKRDNAELLQKLASFETKQS